MREEKNVIKNQAHSTAQQSQAKQSENKDKTSGKTLKINKQLLMIGGQKLKIAQSLFDLIIISYVSFDFF